MDANNSPPSFHMNKQLVDHHQVQWHEKRQAPLPSSSSSSSAAAAAALLGVKKPSTKPWKKKQLLEPPIPPKVYRVEPHGFRQLVQRLTGASSPSLSSRKMLKDAAPEPLNLDQLQQRELQVADQLMSMPVLDYVPFSSGMHRSSSPEGMLGLMPSPSFFSAYMAWSSHTGVISSPGTMESLEQSTVL